MALEAQKRDVDNGSAAAVTFTAMKTQLYVEAPKASDAVQFFKAAFGAEEVNRVTQPKRKADQELPLLSVELKLGSSSIIVSDLFTDDSAAHVKAVTGGIFCLQTEEVELAVERAVKAGAVAESEGEASEGECCGGRASKKLNDPYGNVWLICSPSKKTAEVEA